MYVTLFVCHIPNGIARATTYRTPQPAYPDRELALSLSAAPHMMMPFVAEVGERIQKKICFFQGQGCQKVQEELEAVVYGHYQGVFRFSHQSAVSVPTPTPT